MLFNRLLQLCLCKTREIKNCYDKKKKTKKIPFKHLFFIHKIVFSTQRISFLNNKSYHHTNLLYFNIDGFDGRLMRLHYFDVFSR